MTDVAPTLRERVLAYRVEHPKAAAGFIALALRARRTTVQRFLDEAAAGFVPPPKSPPKVKAPSQPRPSSQSRCDALLVALREKGEGGSHDLGAACGLTEFYARKLLLRMERAGVLESRFVPRSALGLVPHGGQRRMFRVAGTEARPYSKADISVKALSGLRLARTEAVIALLRAGGKQDTDQISEALALHKEYVRHILHELVHRRVVTVEIRQLHKPGAPRKLYSIAPASEERAA